MLWMFPLLWLLQACMLSGGPDTQTTTSPAPQIAFRVGHQFSVLKTVCSPDGKLVATGSSDGSIKLWEARTGELLHTMHVPDENVYSLAFWSVAAETPRLRGCGISAQVSWCDVYRRPLRALAERPQSHLHPMAKPWRPSVPIPSMKGFPAKSASGMCAPGAGGSQ